MADPRHSSRMPRPWLVGGVAALVLTAAALWAITVHRPLPPRGLVMATGPDGNVYAELGPRYRSALARSGIELRLQPTAGAVENLARLRDPASEVGVGFVQAGAASTGGADDVVSLGSVFFEPLWLFSRARASGGDIRGWLGTRLSVGPEGSGTRELALRLLALERIDPSSLELLPLTPQEAGERLTRGEIDAAAIVTSFDSPVVRRLIADPEITLASFRRADALAALDFHLDKLVLPEGVGDLARNLPPRDVTLLATKASLAVRRDLDPALQYLLLETAAEIHGGAGLFHGAGRFPGAEAPDLPLSPYARQFYKTGAPWLQRHLPFRLAVFGERFLLLLIPLAGLVYPALRSLPSVYAWSMRRRILKLYAALKSVEADMEGTEGTGNDGPLLGRLDELERRANRLRIPGQFSPLLYDFRIHLGLVRSRLAGTAGRVPPGGEVS